MALAEAAQPADSVDNQLIPAALPDARWFQKNGLEWFNSGDNSDYIAPRILAITRQEMQQYHDAANRIYRMQMEAARHVSTYGLWDKTGIPQAAVSLVEYSLREEAHLHLIGRYDFAGGLEGVPLRLLEFNADTCSLLPETVQLQPEIARKLQIGTTPSWGTFDALVQSFRQLLRRYPDREPTLLLSGIGYEEDTLNLEVVLQAARQAGFAIAQQVELPRVIFSEDEGIFVELGPDRFQRYDFWFKMVPWDFICYEEPELLELLDNIIRNQLAVVINPAFTMLLQSKGLLPVMKKLFPEEPAFLEATFDVTDFHTKKPYFAKPIFGRMGENISAYNEYGHPIVQNDGDYGQFPMIGQESAQLNRDGRGYLYQPGVFYIGQAAGICFRRQDDDLIDDDAQFIAHIVEP